MKTWKWLMATVIPFIMTAPAAAQCVTNLQSVTYDTTVSGTGNDLYTFSFPEFDPSLGTLVEVIIVTNINLTYSFQLENKDGFPRHNYRVVINRDDDISGSALLTPLSSSHQQAYGPYSLAAADGVPGSGADFVSVGPVLAMNNLTDSFTVYNTADFFGSGNISLSYSPQTYSQVQGSANKDFSESAGDNITFSISYRYCDSWFLENDITSFTARQEDAVVNLNWISRNETEARFYKIEVSTDGRHFEPVGQVAANPDATGTGRYHYQYPLPRLAGGRHLFRIQMTELNYSVKYSPLRYVDVHPSVLRQPLLYPNPTTGKANILFSNEAKSDWDVSVYTITGHLLQQYRFSNTLAAAINTDRTLFKGIYIIRAVNRKTQQLVVERLVIN